MINYELNLLSPSKKARLRQVVRFLFAQHIIEAAIFTYAVLAVALLWGWMVLQETFTGLSASVLSINREYSSYNQEIRETNKIIHLAEQSSRGYAPIIPLFLEFASSTPPDIKINSIELNRETGVFAISGTAETRPALLRYQETARAIPWLSFNGSPLTQLWQKENINFSLGAKLKDLSDL